MRKQLQERILLEEPEADLPPVAPKEPIVVSSEPSVEVTPTTVPEIPDEVAKGAFTGTLDDEIKACYDDIERLKGKIATFTVDSPNDAVVSILDSVLDDRTMHVGMLQKAKDIIDPEPTKLVDAGADKADAIAKSTAEGPKDEALKEAEGYAEAEPEAKPEEGFKPTEDDKKMLLDMQHDEIVTIAKYTGYKGKLSEPLHEFIDEINKDEANHRDIFGLLSEGKLDDAEKLG